MANHTWTEGQITRGPGDWGQVWKACRSIAEDWETGTKIVGVKDCDTREEAQAWISRGVVADGASWTEDSVHRALGANGVVYRACRLYRYDYKEHVRQLAIYDFPTQESAKAWLASPVQLPTDPEHRYLDHAPNFF